MGLEAVEKDEGSCSAAIAACGAGHALHLTDSIYAERWSSNMFQPWIAPSRLNLHGMSVEVAKAAVRSLAYSSIGSADVDVVAGERVHSIGGDPPVRLAIESMLLSEFEIMPKRWPGHEG